MTNAEFNSTSFGKGDTAIYKGTEYLIASVDFEESLIGLLIPISGMEENEITWVKYKIAYKEDTTLVQYLESSCHVNIVNDKVFTPANQFKIYEQSAEVISFLEPQTAILLTEEQLLELKKQWMDEPVKMLEQFYSMVARHIVGHKTASNLFFSAINKMKGEENGANKSFLNSIKL